MHKKIPVYLKYYIYRNSKQGKLPSEYQQVEYIESTGTQYIDTGINPISSTRIDINFAYVGKTSSFNWIPIFGSRSIVNNVQEQVIDVLEIIEEFGVEKSECLYIGDTATDIQAAKNAELYSIGVLWGFRDEAELKNAGADVIISDPMKIAEIACE